MFWEGKPVIHNNEHEWQPSTTLGKIVQCVPTLLEDKWCLTITDMQQEMAVYFSHEAGETTEIRALQQLKMHKFAHTGFLDNSRKNI